MSEQVWSKLWVYSKQVRPHNRACPHCVWIEQAYLTMNTSVHGRQFIPKRSKPVKVLTVGNKRVSVLDSTQKFTDAHLVVLGSKGDSKYIKHEQDFRTVLLGSGAWVSHLNTLGINSAFMMMSSHFDENRGEKEHLHTFVCPMGEESTSIFREKFPIPHPEKPKVPILDKPYENDRAYVIPPEHAHKLFTEVKPIEYLVGIFDLELTEKTSWYLFLYFIKTYDGDKVTRHLSGIISVPDEVACQTEN